MWKVRSDTSTHRTIRKSGVLPLALTCRSNQPNQPFMTRSTYHTKYSFLKKRKLALLLLLAASSACTDLDVPVYDKVAVFWSTPEQVEQGVAQAYVLLRNYAPTYYGIPNVY